MKILHFLLFFISVHFFAQSKDNIMLEPHFEIGKVYRIEIFDNNDSFQTIHKKTFKHTTEQKTNVELKYLQKAGSDYLFSWKIIDKDYMNVDIDAKNIIMIDFPENLSSINKT